MQYKVTVSSPTIDTRPTVHYKVTVSSPTIDTRPTVHYKVSRVNGDSYEEKSQLNKMRLVFVRMLDDCQCCHVDRHNVISITLSSTSQHQTFVCLSACVFVMQCRK